MNSIAKTATIRHFRARRRQRGTAFAETAIMLPFLLIVFSSIVYLGHLYIARQQALLTARTCAWEYAYHSCAQLPPGCPQGIFADRTGEPDPALNDQIQNAKSEAQGGNSESPPTGKTKDFADKTNGFLDKMTSFILGEAIEAQTVRTVPSPPVLAHEGRAPASYFLACNTKEQDPIQMAIDLFKALVPVL